MWYETDFFDLIGSDQDIFQFETFPINLSEENPSSPEPNQKDDKQISTNLYDPTQGKIIIEPQQNKNHPQIPSAQEKLPLNTSLNVSPGNQTNSSNDTKYLFKRTKKTEKPSKPKKIKIKLNSKEENFRNSLYKIFLEGIDGKTILKKEMVLSIHEVIKNPLGLDKIKRQNRRCVYSYFQDFANDSQRILEYTNKNKDYISKLVGLSDYVARKPTKSHTKF